MTDFVGKVGSRMGLGRGQKSPFDDQQVMVELDQESRFRFFSCPGHEETGMSRKDLGSTKEHRQSPPQNACLGGIATMPLNETFRRRKPPEEAFLPWPGFFCLDQYLPDSLLGFQADSLCPLQIASKGPGCGCGI